MLHLRLAQRDTEQSLYYLLVPGEQGKEQADILEVRAGAEGFMGIPVMWNAILTALKCVCG